MSKTFIIKVSDEITLFPYFYPLMLRLFSIFLFFVGLFIQVETFAQKSFFWGMGANAGAGNMTNKSGIKTSYYGSGAHLYFRKDFQDGYRDFLSLVTYPGVQIPLDFTASPPVGDTMLLSLPLMIQYSHKKDAANFTYDGTTYLIGVGMERIQKLGGLAYMGPMVALGFRHFAGNQTYELNLSYTRDLFRDSRFFGLRFTLMFGQD